VVCGWIRTEWEFKQAKPEKARGQFKRIKKVNKPQVGKTVVEGYLTEHSPFKAGDGWQVWEANLDSGSGQRKKKAFRASTSNSKSFGYGTASQTRPTNLKHACPPGPARTTTRAPESRCVAAASQGGDKKG
jgi:hypothetical protein